MNTEIRKIISGNQNESDEALKSFIEKNWEVFTFKDLNVDNSRSNLWKVLFGFLGNKEAFALHVTCLKAIRILSRDKTDLDQLITQDRLEILLQQANLKTNDHKSDTSKDYEVELEALKCICNIIYNRSHTITTFSELNCLEGILCRTKIQSDSKSLLDVKLFDMKILFLMTALNSNIRQKVKLLGGLACLMEALNSITNKYDEQTTIYDTALSSAEVDLTCEILKVLFNLTIHKNDEEEKPYYTQLNVILYNLLLIPIENSGKQLELHNHIVNLLTNMPNEYYNSLIIPIKDNEQIFKDLQYEGHNMKAIYQLFLFLKSRFKEEQTIKMQEEQFSPILTVLVKAVTSSRFIRKYLRLKLLPPLKDIYNRPEQGSTIRNCLCRLLTTPIVNVRDLTADLLFKLCKENVGRMIKYTGYGNAAGLFAQRGLLAGGQSINEYSSDSEDSDTEEYKEYKNEINPVIGCYEPPHPDPCAGMTEEQKEYEAMQLVHLMDRLTRGGIVQPCKIGEDGKPQPIEHILQLQEELPNQQVHVCQENN